MKALSIKEPWASMIASGTKTIETRTRKTNFRGWLLLHASQKPKATLSGNVFALAYLSDCVPMTEAHEHQAGCDCYDGAWAWIFKAVYRIPPVPMKGKLGIYEVDEDITRRIFSYHFFGIDLGIVSEKIMLINAMCLEAIEKVAKKEAEKITSQVKRLKTTIKGMHPQIIIVDEASSLDFGQKGLLKIDSEPILRRFQEMKEDGGLSKTDKKRSLSETEKVD